MARGFLFTSSGWEDYLYWQSHDKQILKKINKLLQEIARDPLQGIGKPEPLRGDLSGAWSRRITDEHRLVYVAEDAAITVLACRYHYER